jgi:transcriptional regulator with XRE-family HTH domain
MYSVRHGKLRKEMAAARDAARMTQRDLAAKLKRPPSFVAKVENGERKIEVFEFVDWCAAVGVEPAGLLKKIKD